MNQPATAFTPDAARRAPLRLNREDAVRYLHEHHGIPMTLSALRLHDWRGTGPKRSLILSRIYYLVSEIDAWVEGLAEKGRQDEANEQ